MSRRKPVRNPDLLHAFASVGAQRVLSEEKKSVPKVYLRSHPHIEGPISGRGLCGFPIPDKKDYEVPLCDTCATLAPHTSFRKELNGHDLDIVRRSVKLAMGGGYSQVYGWSGLGFKEHWADSIALGIVTAREGAVDTDWVHQVRLAVYMELGLEVVDVATPFRMSDLTGDKK